MNTKTLTPLPDAAELVSFRQRILEWFDRNGRSFYWRQPDISDYEAVIAEIMLQRTKADTVERFLIGFFTRYPSWQHISASSETELGAILKPLGLWRRRASTLFLLANQIVANGGAIPKAREEIELLPGVGQYIANAIELVCFGAARPLIDGNMARVLERYFGPRKMADIRYDPYLQQLAAEVVRTRRSLHLNWAILDLAALVCLARTPECWDCPVKLGCEFAKEEI